MSQSEKVPLEGLEGKHAQVPHALLLSMNQLRCSATELRLLQVLLMRTKYAGPNKGTAWPSTAQLAADCCCCESSIEKARASLGKKGLLEWKQGGTGHANVYRVVVPEERQPTGDKPAGAVTAADVRQAYLDRFLDWNDDQEPPTGSTLGRVAKQAKALLAEGRDPQQVLEAAENAAREGHANLDSAYDMLTVANTRQPRYSTTPSVAAARNTGRPDDSPAQRVFDALKRHKGTDVAAAMRAWVEQQEGRSVEHLCVRAMEADADWRNAVAGRLADLLEQRTQDSPTTPVAIEHHRMAIDVDALAESSF